MRSYQEMAEAVFREGDARLAVHKKRRKAAATTSAVCLAAAVCLVLGVRMRRAVVGETPKSLSAPVPSAVITTDAPPATAKNNAGVTEKPRPEGTTGQPGEPTSTRRTPADERPAASQGDPMEEDHPTPTRTEPTEPATSEPVAPSNPSGAASYNSADWTEAAVNQNGWARFPRWPGYEDKFWVYYDGRTYRCDPFAGRPLEYGEYLCALSDCPHDFADEDGAGVYAMMENGAPVPATAAVVIVFPDGDSYAMIRPATD